MKILRLIVASLSIPLVMAQASQPVIAASACDDAKEGTFLYTQCQACKGSAANSTFCKDITKDQKPGNNAVYGPNGILTRITKVISIAVGVGAIIMIMIGGFKYILANGDSASISNAKNTILYAVIGLIVALVAQGIVIFVLNKL